jgi:virulence-associated protein VapD
MFAIAFDLVVAEAEKFHPEGFSQVEQWSDFTPIMKNPSS